MSEIRHEPVARTHSRRRAPGEVVDRHRHDTHQLVYVSNGLVAVRTEKGSYVAAPNCALWIPAGVWHEHRFYGQTAFHSIGFDDLDPPLRTTEPTVLDVGSLFREVVVACADEQLDAEVAAHLRAVLRDALRAARAQPQPLPHGDDPRLVEACDRVLDDLGTPHTLRDLARAVGTSERTLSRLFRTELGTTFPQWRMRARTFRAMVELAEGVSVTQTGQRCGWTTTSAFIETFTRVAGRTPGAYRAAATRRSVEPVD